MAGLTTTLNGSDVIARTKDAVYVRIPEQFQALAGDGLCGCPYCKAHPDRPAKWDTLVVPVEKSKHGSDYAYTVHLPDPSILSSGHR